MNLLTFFGASALLLARTVRASVSEGLSWRECLRQLHELGVRSTWLVMSGMAFFGAVLVTFADSQARKVTGNLPVVGPLYLELLVCEFGLTVSAPLAAACSGASHNAELSTMTVQEQVEAQVVSMKQGSSRGFGETVMNTRWVMALATLVALNACATASSVAERTAAQPLLETRVETTRNRALQADSDAIFARLSANFAPARLGDKEFTAALLTLVLDAPMRVVSTEHDRDMGFGGSGQEAWQSDLRSSYGRFCELRGAPGDCLTLLEDGPELQASDKRSIALALAVGPALEGLNVEIRAMVDPSRIMATVSFTLAAYLALCVAPEPISKGVALVFSALMWGYLGVEFFDLLSAYVELHHDAAQATSFEELREIGHRFGQVIGPNSVRILVMVGTATVGETASLLSKAEKLPGFLQASSRVKDSVGIPLADVLQSERLFISASEGAIRSVIPATAVAMTAGGADGPATPSSDSRAFKSFADFKRAMGSAGEGRQWHHIVEQRDANLKRFGPEALHNTENVVPLEEKVHLDVSAFYSSKQDFITGSPGLTVRQWIGGQSYEAQRQFGLLAIKNIRGGVWRVLR